MGRTYLEASANLLEINSVPDVSATSTSDMSNIATLVSGERGKLEYINDSQDGKNSPNTHLNPKELKGIKEIIITEAQKEGVDSKIALAIVECESNFQRFARNKFSSAESYFQFLDTTWHNTMRRMGLATSTDKFDPEIHIKAGIFLLKYDGTSHWQESKNCWTQKLL